MKTRICDVGEDVLLDAFRRWFPRGGALRVGPGDDCAVIAGHLDDHLLKTDAMVEGVHYTHGEAPRRVGHKAVARVFSDIAAMGGTPCHLLVTLALPARTPVAWLEGFYDGARSLADRYLCRIAGGELTRLPETAGTVISVCATGRIARGRGVLRDGARPGDVVAVSGHLGGSLASGHHLDFEPRLAEGQWLAGQGGVRAMMDLSDGLAKDLPRLARASGCGFRLDGDKLPLRPGCSVAQAIGDGEDYELLVGIAAAAWPRIRRGWAHAFPATPLTAIGAMVDAPAASSPAMTGGWDPFRP